MKNRFLKLIALASVTCGMTISAVTTELRSPLSLIYNFGPIHYRLDPLNECPWHFDFFSALYARRADRGFGIKNSRNTVSLSTLFFGADQFTVSQAFAGGMGLVPGNPFIGFATINPAFHYTEQGIVGGFHLERRLDECEWEGFRVGLRTAMPFKLIRLERDLGCLPLENDNLNDVALRVLQRIDPTINIPAGTGLQSVANPGGGDTTVLPVAGANIANPDSTVQAVYAYRLDFLTSMNFPGTTTSVVQYTDPTTTPAGNITIANIDVTQPAMQTTPAINQANFTAPQVTNGTAGLYNINAIAPFLLFPQNATRDVYAIRSVDGTIGGLIPTGAITLPNGEWSIARDVAPDGGSVAADGSGGGNGSRLQFNPITTTDYTPLSMNPAAQRQLFIIPNSDGAGHLLADAAELRQTVNFIIESSIASAPGNAPALASLLANGIDFCNNQRINGIGDLDTDFYLGYDWCDNAYAELTLGLRWPTGKRNRTAGLVYAQTPGNNGHFEIKGQIDLGYAPTDWLGLHIDGSISHVFRRIERKAAAFVGATIRNVGLTTDAHVSYNWGAFHADVTIFSPENCNLGLVVSYELYGKTRDKVEFVNAMALDLNGVPQVLDPVILERNTNAMTNKIRGEMFHRWDFCELFIGASRSFAGRNAFKETEAHIGIEITF